MQSRCVHVEWSRSAGHCCLCIPGRACVECFVTCFRPPSNTSLGCPRRVSAPWPRRDVVWPRTAGGVRGRPHGRALPDGCVGLQVFDHPPSGFRLSRARTAIIAHPPPPSALPDPKCLQPLEAVHRATACVAIRSQARGGARRMVGETGGAAPVPPPPPLQTPPPCNLPPPPGRPSVPCFSSEHVLCWFVLPICFTHGLALLSHYFKSSTGVCSVIFSLQRRCMGVLCCHFRPKMFSPGDHVRYRSHTLGAHVLATVVGPSPNGPQFCRIRYSVLFSYPEVLYRSFGSSITFVLDEHIGINARVASHVFSVEGTTVCLEIPLQPPPPPGDRHLATVSPPPPTRETVAR